MAYEGVHDVVSRNVRTLGTVCPCQVASLQLHVEVAFGHACL